MNEVEMNVLQIEDKKYFLVDTIVDNEVSYYFFSNVEDSEDIYVFKDKKEGEEEFFVSLENEKELERALTLFYEKYKD